jgi:SAM-dependent methyltransferase
MNEYLQVNQNLWDKWTPIHVKSEFYDVAGFKAGRCSLLDVDVAEIGDVAGQSLLHLQCHFGQDTLSWSRRGATVTGVDFSTNAIAQAKKLAAECDLDGRFICCNLYDLGDHLDETFDIVFTSAGVLLWLPDLHQWAQLIARYLKPGGTFYIREFHPVVYMLDEDEKSDKLAFRWPYFNTGQPMKDTVEGSYADPDADIKAECYDWACSMGEVVTELINAGLQIEFLHEFNYCECQLIPQLKQGDDGKWRYNDLPGGLPLMFSIRAVKQ